MLIIAHTLESLICQTNSFFYQKNVIRTRAIQVWDSRLMFPQKKKDTKLCNLFYMFMKHITKGKFYLVHLPLHY